MGAAKFSWKASKADGSAGGRLLEKMRQSAAPAIVPASSRDALLLLQSFEESGRGWFWSTDADGRLTYITASISEQLGMEPSAILGKHLVEIFRKNEDVEDRQRSLPFLMMRQSSFENLPLQGWGIEDESGGRFRAARFSTTRAILPVSVAMAPTSLRSVLPRATMTGWQPMTR